MTAQAAMGRIKDFIIRSAGWFNSSRSARAVLFLALTLGFIHPIFEHVTWFGGWDQGYFHGFDETARKTVLDYGQVPLWNPYHCGGRTLAGHVANLHLHPLFWLLALPFGTAIAYKLYLLIHVFLAMFGMDLYLRARGADGVGSILGAVAFGASGYFSWHFAGGHISYYGLALTPWLLIFLDRSREHIRYGIWAGLVLASVFLMGGAYSYPFMVLLVAVHVLVFCIKDRSARVFWAASIAALVSLGAAGLKTGPVLDFTLQHGRPSALLESIAPWEFVQMLLSRSHEYGRWLDHPFTWPEYGAYIGYAAFGLAVIAMLTRPRKHLYFIGMAVFFLSLCLGKHTDYSPYALLRRLPVYADLRVPSRYMVFVCLYFGALAAFAITAWRSRSTQGRFLFLPAWLHRWLAGLIVLAGVIEILSFSHVELRRTYKVDPVNYETGRAFYQGRAGRPQVEAYLGPYRNVGIVNCYEEGANPRSAFLRHGKRPQVFLAQTDKGLIKGIKWSPNRIDFTAELVQTGLVVLNHNYDHNWDAGDHPLVDYRGLTAVRLSKGNHQVSVRYSPISFTIGFLVSLLTLFGIGLTFWLIRRRDQKAWSATFFPSPKTLAPNAGSAGGDEEPSGG